MKTKYLVSMFYSSSGFLCPILATHVFGNHMQDGVSQMPFVKVEIDS